jgi:DNA-binding transcriptional LysR family regulator
MGRLERRLGVRLLDRTTRRVGVTELGQRLLADAVPSLAALQAAVAGLDEAREQPAGLLKLNVSRVASDILLRPHLSEFIATYPHITLELSCENRFVDLVGTGFDAGIRLGESLAQDMVAVPLGPPQRLATVASPQYLRRHAPPLMPEDLREHRCMNLRLSTTGLYRWEYERDGRALQIEVHGALICNDNSVLLDAVRAGAGIGCAFEAEVRADLDAGRLVPLLQAWWPTFAGFHLYHMGRAQVPRKLRVFIDFFRARLTAP